MYPYLFNQTWLPMYGLLISLGIGICVLLKYLFIKLPKEMELDFTLSMCFCLIGAILGAKLLFLATIIPELIDGTYQLIQVIKGGFVFYGGFIGGFLGIYIYHLIYKNPLKPVLNACAILVPLGQCFGRIGCFCGGCCYGKETDSWLGVVYQDGVPLDINTPTGVKLLPVQLFESAFCLLLFIFLLVFYFKKKNITDGPYLYIYGISYAIWRFFIEFFRGDAERGSFIGLSTSQIISIGLALMLVIVLLLKCFKKKRTLINN